MKIAYCIAATFNPGGMERVLANKTNYLVALGHEIIVITTDQQGRSSYFPFDKAVRFYDLGVNYQDHAGLGIWKKTNSFFRKQRLHKSRLTQLLLELRADIVVSMFDQDVSFLYKIKDGSAKVLEIHFSRFKRLQYGRKGIWRMMDRIRSKQDKYLASRYERFVVLTEEDRGYWGDMSNIAVIPNANSFVPAGLADTDCQRAIAVGRLDEQKGFDELLSVWQLVKDTYPDWHLDIYGKGPLQDSLQKQIEEYGLREQIRLREPVQDIEFEYKTSAFLIMTSRYEGLPMSLLEAQACGLPLIAYACKCGPRDVIKEGENGFLIPEGDRQAMVSQTIKLMDNSALRKQMGKRAKEMSENFSEEKVMAQWLNMFNALLG